MLFTKVQLLVIVISSAVPFCLPIQINLSTQSVLSGDSNIIFGEFVYLQVV